MEDSDDDDVDMMNDMSENPNLHSDQKGISVGNETIPDDDYKPKNRSQMPRSGVTRSNKIPGSIITNQIGMNNQNMRLMPQNTAVKLNKSPKGANISSPKDFEKF